MIARLAALLAGATAPGLFVWRGDPSLDIRERARSAGWVVRELDTVDVRDSAGLYDQIAADWDLPAWFGRNLDALWDVLGDLAATPLVVIWEGCAAMAEADPELTQILLELLRDASTQAPALAVVVLDAPPLIGLDALL